VLLWSDGGSAREVLEVKLSRLVVMEPGLLRVTIHVARAEDHRFVTIEADSDTFYRSSRIPLDGRSAPSTYVLDYASLPAGHYFIRVALQGTGGTVATVERRVAVLGGLDDTDVS
jgi:hypothetical protein